MSALAVSRLQACGFVSESLAHTALVLMAAVRIVDVIDAVRWVAMGCVAGDWLGARAVSGAMV
jgi:hypothetical protein